MEKRAMASIIAGDTIAHTTIDDLKLRVAEHIINQYGDCGTTDVWGILAETKVGVWTRPALVKKLKMVFLAA